MIRSIAFHPKAMNDINNNGRSSDLFLLRAPSRKFFFQWLKVGCLQHNIELTAAGLFRIYT